MKKIGKLILIMGLLTGCSTAFAQNSAPAPGSPQGMNGNIPLGPGPVISAPGSPSGLGNGPAPAPGSGIYNPGAPTPPPPQPGNWGSPWNNGPLIINTPLSSPDWQNNGYTTVMACGYDAQGVWRTIPLRVEYDNNGAFYNVTVISAWNPWTNMWNYNVDQPAYNTSYFLNGRTYDFYTNLSTGTFYFNL